MPTDLTRLKRKPFLFPLLMPVLLIGALLVAAIWLLDARATTVVVVIRHAETEPANDADPPLDVSGRERAARLARVLSQAKPERGVDAIFASEQRRTQQTVAPLSEMVALPVNVVPIASWDSLPDKILSDHHGEFVVIAGNAMTIPSLIAGLGGGSVTVGESEYDAMFIVFVPRFAKPRVMKLRY